MSIDEIKNLLTLAYPDAIINVFDESREHAGHAEMTQGDGVTHIFVKITSDELSSLKRVECHRKVNKTLKPAFKAGLHAMSLEITNKRKNS